MLGYGARANVPTEAISLIAQADHLAAQIRASEKNAAAHVVGHSVGGAVAMMLARQHPEMVVSLIDVEGNFTLGDAFWTSKLAAMTLSEIETLLRDYQSDPSGWLTRAGIEPMPERIATASRGLRAQPAATVKAMAQAVIETTSRPDYLSDVKAVLDSGIPMHLFACGLACPRIRAASGPQPDDSGGDGAYDDVGSA